MTQTCKSWNTMTTNEKFSHHTKCENCGSRDNRGIWLNPDDTIHHTYCFGCHEYTAGGEPIEKPKQKVAKDFEDPSDNFAGMINKGGLISKPKRRNKK